MAEYLALGAAGILAKEERVELLDGETIRMAPIGNRHQHSVDWLADLLHEASIGRRAVVQVQGSIQLDDVSAPRASHRRHPTTFHKRHWSRNAVRRLFAG